MRANRILDICEAKSYDDFNLLKSDPAFKNIWTECSQLMGSNKLVSSSADNSDDIGDLINKVEANGQFKAKLTSGNYSLYNYDNQLVAIGISPEGDSLIITTWLNRGIFK